MFRIRLNRCLLLLLLFEIDERKDENKERKNIFGPIKNGY